MSQRGFASPVQEPEFPLEESFQQSVEQALVLEPDLVLAQGQARERELELLPRVLVPQVRVLPARKR